MAGRSKGDAQPGQTWNRHFNHPYTARKTPPRPSVPIVGANSSGYQGPWAPINSAIGPIYGLRGYNTTAEGVPAAYPGPGTGVIPPGVPPAGQVISIRPDIGQVLSGSLDGALATYFSTVPAGAYVTLWHEGEIGGQNAGYSQAQIIAMHTRVYGIFQANAPVAASYGQIIATVSAVSGSTGFPLGPWMCTAANGGANLDFYGMDIDPTSQTTTFADTIGTAMTAMTGAGVSQSGPWTICEVSSTSQWRSSQSQWLSDGWNTAQAIGALHYLLYFNNNQADALQHWPVASIDTVRVLQDVAAISRGDPRPPAAGPPTRDTTAAWVSSTSSFGLTATFTSNPAAGSKVLVVVQAGFAATLAVTDNGTTPSAFRLDGSCMNTSGLPSLFLYRADNITLPASGTYAVSVTRSPAGSLQIGGCAYGSVQNGPPSATSGIIGTGNNPAVTPVTPADISSLFFETFFANSASNPESITSASPEFTVGAAQVNGTSLFTGAVSDALATSPAPRAGGWTLNDAPAHWSALMAAYAAFPSTITLVPGANSAWAQSPDPDPGITVNAGVAAATGAAQGPAVTAAPSPGTASGSGWAAVNAPATNTSPSAGLASAAGTALPAAANVIPAAGTPAATGVPATATATVQPGPATAAATGAAPFTPGSNISLTLTALTPVGAAGTADSLDAEIDTSPAASAATGAALQPATPSPGVAAATGAALQPTVVTGTAPVAATAAAAGAAAGATATVTVTAGAAPASGAAPQAAMANPATATGTGAALQPAGHNTGAAPAAAAAQAPAVTVTAAAGTAAATGTAAQPTVVTGVAPSAGLAAATGTAQQPAITITLTAATAAGTGAGLAAAHGINAGVAAATGTAPAPSLTSLAQASAAQALAAALNATGQSIIPAVFGTATATGTAVTTATASGTAVTTATAGGRP